MLLYNQFKGNNKIKKNKSEGEQKTVKELKSYDINQIDVITANEDKIYIYF